MKTKPFFLDQMQKAVECAIIWVDAQHGQRHDLRRAAKREAKKESQDKERQIIQEEQNMSHRSQPSEQCTSTLHFSRSKQVTHVCTARRML